MKLLRELTDPMAPARTAKNFGFVTVIALRRIWSLLQEKLDQEE